jgi:hypothetical protein
MMRPILLMLLALSLAAADRGITEPTLPDAARASLGEWEARALKKADDLFFGRDKGAQKDRYRLASPAYKAFCDEFPQVHQTAICYAIYQEGRAYQLDNKRTEARARYKDILEFFANETAFATAAAWFMGQSHADDGDTELAMRAFAVIAKDAGYRKQPLAARALVELAGWTWKQGKLDQAVEYFRDVAKTFRRSNPDAAQAAIAKVVEYHVRHRRDFAQLLAFFQEVEGFGRDPRKIPGDAAQDGELWKYLREQVRKLGEFPADQAEQRKEHFAYWAGQMEGKRATDDDFHKDRSDFLREADGDAKAWAQRLDQQFQAQQKAGDNARILKFMGWFKGDKDRLKEYYGKLAFESMAFAQLLSLAALLYDQVGPELGLLVVQKIRLDTLKDGERAELAKFMYDKDPSYVRTVIQSFQVLEDGDRCWFDLLAKDAEATLDDQAAAAAKLSKSEKHNGEVQWAMGELYERARKYDLAIGAYYASNKAKEMGFAVARCHFLNGKVDACLAELTAIETTMRQEFGPVAAYARAEYLDKAKRHEERNATLYRIQREYKNTKYTPMAHAWAEKLGLPQVIGTDDE